MSYLRSTDVHRAVVDEEDKVEVQNMLMIDRVTTRNGNASKSSESEMKVRCCSNYAELTRLTQFPDN